MATVITVIGWGILWLALIAVILMAVHGGARK
jgi:hypothetical protein